MACPAARKLTGGSAATSICRTAIRSASRVAATMAPFQTLRDKRGIWLAAQQTPNTPPQQTGHANEGLSCFNASPREPAGEGSRSAGVAALEVVVIGSYKAPMVSGSTHDDRTTANDPACEPIPAVHRPHGRRPAIPHPSSRLPHTGQAAGLAGVYTQPAIPHPSSRLPHNVPVGKDRRHFSPRRLGQHRGPALDDGTGVVAAVEGSRLTRDRSG